MKTKSTREAAEWTPSSSQDSVDTSNDDQPPVTYREPAESEIYVPSTPDDTCAQTEQEEGRSVEMTIRKGQETITIKYDAKAERVRSKFARLNRR